MGYFINTSRLGSYSSSVNRNLCLLLESLSRHPKASIIIFTLLLMPIGLHAEQTLRDPAERDEDISSVKLVTTVAKEGKRYLYRYEISTPVHSIGYPDSFNLDIACPEIPNMAPTKSIGGPGQKFRLSRDGSHVDVDVRVPGDAKFDAGVTAFNEVTFNVPVPRGKTKSFEVLSPSPPGYRLYYIEAETVRNLRFYDYSTVDESERDDPLIPSDSDWEVWGVTLGPACAQQVANPTTPAIFDGQKTRFESRRINQLLRYEVDGNRNRLHAQPSQSTFKMRIYYAENIDVNTFKADLNGLDISALFEPDSGSSEVVSIPLSSSRSRITISAAHIGAVFEDGSLDDRMVDIDPFEIRLQSQSVYSE